VSEPLTERYRGYVLTAYRTDRGWGWQVEDKWAGGIWRSAAGFGAWADENEALNSARRVVNSRYMMDADDVERGLARMG
jgi:hypothetical protein